MQAAGIALLDQSTACVTAGCAVSQPPMQHSRCLNACVNMLCKTVYSAYLDELQLAWGQCGKLALQGIRHLRLTVPGHLPQGLVVVNDAHVLLAQPTHRRHDEAQLINVCFASKQGNSCRHLNQQTTCLHQKRFFWTANKFTPVMAG